MADWLLLVLLGLGVLAWLVVAEALRRDQRSTAPRPSGRRARLLVRDRG